MRDILTRLICVKTRRRRGRKLENRAALMELLALYAQGKSIPI